MAASARDRILTNTALDGLMAALAWPGALWLAAPGPLSPGALMWLPVAILALLGPGWVAGLPRQYWRFAGLPEMVAACLAAGAAAVLMALAVAAVGGVSPNPAAPLIHALLLAALLAAPRIAARLRHAGRAGPATEMPAQPVLLVGAGDAADLFLRALAQERSPAFRVTGLLALRERQMGRRLHGLPILGTVEEAARVLDRLREEGQLPAQLILADGALEAGSLQQLLDAADRHGLPVRRAPRPTALDPASRRPGERAEEKRLHLRPIEIEDLLERPQVPLDREGMAQLVQGRRVLVTGAGGSIGGELSRQVAMLGPASLTLLDHGEYALYEIDLELRERHPEVARRAVLADVRDAARIGELMQELRPELVFHAAALKHVPMLEANPLEAPLTNALGTLVVANAARAAGCGLMVFISTDKAVNPSSMMGASKRLAEMYCQALDRAARAAGAGMRLVTVRFGNVLGSTGSVVPLFRRQLERGGPLTVTHPDMSRYFMTVREAVGLVLQASVIGAGDGPEGPPELREGGIFVLDMGEPVKIVDMARRMIRLAGLRPDEDVAIRFTGLRPGEKLYEELFHGQEAPRPTRFAGLLMATPRTNDAAEMAAAIAAIAADCRAGDRAAVMARLAVLVPEFTPDQGGKT